MMESKYLLTIYENDPSEDMKWIGVFDNLKDAYDWVFSVMNNAIAEYDDDILGNKIEFKWSIETIGYVR